MTIGPMPLGTLPGTMRMFYPISKNQLSSILASLKTIVRYNFLLSISNFMAVVVVELV